FAADDRPPAGIHRLATVASTAEVAPDASIGPFTVIGDGARIGLRSIVHANVTIGNGVHVGDRVIVQDGAVIGSDGFGFAARPDGTHQKIPQVGAVVIEDDVEIGANAAIDRPAVGETRIG